MWTAICLALCSRALAMGPAVQVGARAVGAPPTIVSPDCNSNGVADAAEVPELDFIAARQFAVGPEMTGVVAADFTGDGAIDLAVSSGGDRSIVVLPNRGDATFGAPLRHPLDYGLGSITAGDLNRDGRPDLVAANSGGVWVLRNVGGGTFAPVLSYATDRDPSGIAIADLDGDDDADLAVISRSAGTVSILRNAGDATFGPAVALVEPDTLYLPESIAAADLDGDGDQDLVTADHGGISVLRNNGDATFAAQVDYVEEPLDPAQVVAGDLDHDSRPEVIVANSFGRALLMFPNKGDGTFKAARRIDFVYEVEAVAVGDFDADGDPDVAALENGFRPRIALLLNDGNGTLAAPVSIPAPFGHSLVVADLDGDARLDLVVGASGQVGHVAIVRNRSQSGFSAAQALPVGNDPVAVTAVDLSGDGRADLAVANGGANSLSVIHATTNGLFGEAVDYPLGSAPSYGSARMGVAAGDFDSDGKRDVVVVNPETNTLSLLRNHGGGMFEDPVPVPAGRAAATVAAADVDGNGTLDLVTASVPDGVVVLRNRGGGAFDPPASYGAGPAYALAIADFDEDGHPDIAAANGGLHTVSILYNRGDGTLDAPLALPVTFDSVVSVVAADLDGDQHVDLAVTVPSESDVQVLRSMGGGTFAEPVGFAAGFGAFSINAIDVDADGDVDLAVASLSAGLALLRNDGHGFFAAPVEWVARIGNELTSQTLAAGDFDANGRADFVVVDEVNDLASVSFNVSPQPVSQDCNGDRVPDQCQLDDDCSGNGTPDVCEPDSDGDGTVDACDVCRGGDEHPDSDADGVPDSCDNCPALANPGQANADADLAGDACDGCVDDPLKTAPRICGCGVLDLDVDGDRTEDCRDGCPYDYDKTAPGRCGCGEPELPNCASPTPTRTPTGMPMTPTATPTRTPTQRHAAFVASSVVDAVDVAPGDGVCAAASGECTLRAAIQEANAVPGEDAIDLPAGTYVLALAGAGEDATATGDLDVLDDLRLRGAGTGATIVDGGDIDRVLEIAPSARLSLGGLALQNGQYSGPDFEFGIDVVGGLYNRGEADLRDCVVRDNYAVTIGTSIGGITNTGRLTLTDCLVSRNYGGGVGGLLNGGTLTLRRTVFEDNIGESTGDLANSGSASIRASAFRRSRAFGGAIGNGRGVLTMVGSEVADTGFDAVGIAISGGSVALRDSAIRRCDGGGIRNGDEFSAGTLSTDGVTIADSAHGPGLTNSGTVTLVRTTVNNNQGDFDGGGISNGGIMTLTNVTISGNLSRGSGGGILNYSTVRATNTTITDNTSADGGGVYNSPGATFEVGNTIIAGNHDPAAPDCSGVLVSSGFNLFGSISGCVVNGEANGNLIGVDPRIGPLLDNFGVTRTHALDPDSPAIDAGNPAPSGSGAAACAPDDQRAVPRPHGAACDIGAFEATLRCGDRDLDAPEECDDGGLVGGDCCSGTCQFEHPPLAGDAGCDGAVTAADLPALIAAIPSSRRSICRLEDANGDCIVTVEDLAATVAAIFRGDD